MMWPALIVVAIIGVAILAGKWVGRSSERYPLAPPKSHVRREGEDW